MIKGTSTAVVPLGPTRIHKLALGSGVTLLLLGVVAGRLFQGRFTLDSDWKLVAVGLAGIVFPLFFFRERSLDLQRQQLRLGKRLVSLVEIEAVCLYSRIHLVDHHRGEGPGRFHDPAKRPSKVVRWHVEALRGAERVDGESTDLLRRCIDRVLQLGHLPHAETERERAARKLAPWWRASDVERIRLGWGGSALRLRAELVARHADVPLIDLSGDSIEVSLPAELDTPLLERVRTGNVEVQRPGPAPGGVNDRGLGQLLRLDWNPLWLHPKKTRVLGSLIMLTALGLGVAFGLTRLLPDSWTAGLRSGGLALVGITWLVALLRAAWIQVDPTEVRSCSRWLINLKKSMPLGALEAVRVNPLLSSQLELLGDERRIAIPLERSVAVWVRRRLLAHLASLAEAGVHARRPQVPRQRQKGLVFFVSPAIGLLLGCLSFSLMAGVQPNAAESVAEQEPAGPNPTRPTGVRQDDKEALAGRVEPSFRVIGPDGRGPDAGPAPASRSDGATVPAAPRDGGVAGRARPTAPVDEADAGPPPAAGGAAQPGDPTATGPAAVAGRGSGQPVSWRGLGAFAVRIARTHRVELELSRLGDRMRIRGRALEAKRQRGAARCVSRRCPLLVRVHPARDVERAFSTRRVRLKRRISEKFGRFELELSARKICARQPRYLAISIDGPGELGARIDGDRFVLATDEGLCRGHSDLPIPEE